jgi:hypothetical protein
VVILTGDHTIGLYPRVNYTVEKSVVRLARIAWSAYCDA